VKAAVSGDETGDGSEAAPFATLGEAYDAALASGTRKRIVVLSDLMADAEIVLDGQSASDDEFVTIDGGGHKIERNTGSNESVLQIAGGAKIQFENIRVNGKNVQSSSGPVNNRAIKVTGSGTVVTLDAGTVVTGAFTGNLTLQGSGISVDGGGKLVMNKGSEVTDCVGGSNCEGTVCVTGDGSVFEMNEGSRIHANKAYRGGGVAVYEKAAFTLKGGEISVNQAAGQGGGVYGGSNAVISIENSGVISENTAGAAGGGIFINGGTTLTMASGEIRGNHATTGGGAYLAGGTFTMKGGEIRGNNAGGAGGVYLGDGSDYLDITGGVIYGSEDAVPKALRNNVIIFSSYAAAINRTNNDATVKIGDTVYTGDGNDETKKWNSTVDLRGNS
jgi:hypothetical protein